MKYIKEFFLFSLTSIMLLAAGTTSLYLWKNEKSKQEQRIKNEEKRKKLTKDYKWDLYFYWSIILDEKRSDEAVTIAFEEIDEIKNNMLTDGYDRAEISELELAGYRKANLYVKENLK